MSNRSGDSDGAGGFGAGYAAFQMAKALTTACLDPDPAVRARAEARAARWQNVIGHLRAGTADYGSRTPFADAPAWVTLEVATGGFATGRWLAGGELVEHERALAAALPGVQPGRERLDLNLWHLGDAGMDALRERLRSGDYRIDVPEEAALPMVVWLLDTGRVDDAWSLVDTIAPFFDRLRFFPPPAQGLPAMSGEVHVFTAGDVMERLAALRAQPHLAAQRQAVEVRLPLHDRAVALFLDTYVDGWPCRQYLPGWPDAARALCDDIAAASRAAGRVPRPAKDRRDELAALLALCVRDPAALDGRQVGRIRRIVDDFVRAHGRPGSDTQRALRERQRQEVAAPAHHLIGKAVSARLAAVAPTEGIADFAPLAVPITAAEAQAFALESGTTLPPAIVRRLERCRRGTIAELIACGVITSADTVARVLPALTAEIRGAGFADPVLRRLYAATYRAFRRRRSLLLLDLQHQVALAELPWIEVVESARSTDAALAASARQALVESAMVVVDAFPQAILPNKLLQEYRALAATAQLDLPFVDEIATDIFMGEFTHKFIDAARRAARTLAGTLYADYYAIDTQALAALVDKPKASSRRSLWRTLVPRSDPLATLAAERAGVPLGTWRPATNGMILEQVQILTTHNLALLFDDLGLKPQLQPRLASLALRCFAWLCARQQMPAPHWRDRLIALKNAAYAWRQMLFFLSMLDAASRREALASIEHHFHAQPDAFRTTFDPAMRGLRRAANGERLPQQAPGPDGARVFLGWTTGRHWMMG